MLVEMEGNSGKVYINALLITHVSESNGTTVIHFAGDDDSVVCVNTPIKDVVKSINGNLFMWQDKE